MRFKCGANRFNQVGWKASILRDIHFSNGRYGILAHDHNLYVPGVRVMFDIASVVLQG